MATVSGNRISDDRMVAATGRARAEWFALLDAAGAATWKHPQIAGWLVDEHDVDGWWAQSVTVAFEQERGLRLPGQQADGTFSVTASKTVTASRQRALDAVVAAGSSAFGAPTAVTPDSKYAAARWHHGSSATVASLTEQSGGRVLITLTRSRIPDRSGVGPAKRDLRAAVQSAAESVALLTE